MLLGKSQPAGQWANPWGQGHTDKDSQTGKQHLVVHEALCHALCMLHS
jgi:hypothetical protein